MSTRSNIAIEDPKTKKIKVIYVHSDGYPYGVGKILVDNYNQLTNYLNMVTLATWETLTTSAVSIPEIGTEKKIKPEPIETSGCL
jgi:hypothetical protein